MTLPTQSIASHLATGQSLKAVLGLTLPTQSTASHLAAGQSLKAAL
ncbi:hypothetical protein [Acinetobacter terrestris]|nr:hypothetical protein [Acinetobacter terrestris]